jgi:16S rRNA (uracil1498-N3)-methyltransferase
MPRIYLPITDIKDNQVLITDEKARYLISVLRCRKGDELIIFDGKSNCLKTRILKADRREVITEVIEKFSRDTESHINITLVQGLLKGEKMDMVIQKTTELGVKEIIPVITERSQLRETRKIARWRKIAEEASRQSGRSIIPTVHDPMEFKEFFSKQASINHTPQSPLTKGGIKGGGFIFYEEGGMKLSKAVEIFKQRFNYTLPSPLPLREGRHTPTPLSRGDTSLHPSQKGTILDSQPSNPPIPPLLKGDEGGFFVFIGPEGGFTKEEFTLAEEKGLLIISLGKRILRAETAAISAVTLVQFLLGDMG